MSDGGATDAASGDRTSRVTNDISVNTIAPETSTISGGSSSIGWPRIASTPLRATVTARSAVTALASATGRNRGPCPIRPLLRALARAARR